MESPEDRVAALVAGAKRFRVELDPGAAGVMLAYLDRLLVVNETLNLTSVRDPAAAVERHLLDALAFGLHARTDPPRRVIDIGSGGGFPGVPIALAWPAAEVHLIDATRKKVDAVRELVEGLAIQNVLAHWARAESIRDLPLADTVTARAVGPLAEVLARASHLVARGGHLVVWKSDQLPDAERAQADRLLARLGMESVPDLSYELGAKRRLVRYRRRTR